MPSNVRWRPHILAETILVLATALWGVLAGPLAAAEQPLLRFVQCSDAHVDSKSADYRLANEKLDYLVSAIKTQTHFPSPDFIIGVGDMITGEGEGIPKLEADFALLKTKLLGLVCPFHPVMGNHECIQQEGDPQYQAPYCKAFGQDRVNYTFRAAGIEFVVLNNAGAPASNRTAVGQARRDWLRGILEASPETPKILCCHIPLVPVRDAAVLKESFHWGSEIAGDEEMLELVTAHADQVLAVLSGHLHLTGVAQFSGIYQIVVSGTASYPCDFACYEVFRDRIRVRVLSLPENLRTPDTDIYAPPVRPKAYTDPAHPTHASYIAGNPSERSLEIKLRRPLPIPGPGAPGKP